MSQLFLGYEVCILWCPEWEMLRKPVKQLESGSDYELEVVVELVDPRVGPLTRTNTSSVIAIDSSDVVIVTNLISNNSLDKWVGNVLGVCGHRQQQFCFRVCGRFRRFARDSSQNGIHDYKLQRTWFRKKAWAYFENYRQHLRSNMVYKVQQRQRLLRAFVLLRVRADSKQHSLLLAMSVVNRLTGR